MDELELSDYSDLIPIECFLNRIFPPGHYKNELDILINKRVFKPRKDCEPFELIIPIDWEAVDNSTDRNWRMQLQGWAMFHPIMNFFDVSENKNKIVDYFFDIIEDWFSNYKNDNEEFVTSRMPDSYAWYDMSVGFRALVLAFFANRISFYKISIGAKRSKLLGQVVDKHIRNLFFEPAFSLNNHGLFQIQGLMALTHLFNTNEHEDKKMYSISKMQDLITSQFSNQGIHMEHSPHYHFYALDTAISIAKTGWYGQEIESYIQKAISAKKWLVDPLKRPICAGDSILTTQKSVEFPDKEEGTDFITGDFSESGYSIVRSNWNEQPDEASMLFMTGMYHTKSHKHRDCLSFDLFERGTRVLCDSGKYGYRSDKYRNYFLSSRAHNSVEIEGFDIIKMKPYGSVLSKVNAKSNGVFELSGGLDYPAIKHKRVLSYRPNSFLLVHDSLVFAREREFIQWFHLEKGFHVVRMSGHSVTFKNDMGNKVTIENFNKDVELVLHYGDEDVMQGFISDRDYKYEPGFAIGFKGHHKSIELCTLITINDDVSKEMIEIIDNKKIGADTRSYNQAFKIDSYKKPLLKNIKHVFLEGKKNFLKGKATYTLLVNKLALNFYVDNKESDYLTIFLPGATNRVKGACDFQRFSWSEDFSETVVSISDPTINDNNDLSIGWFQGTSENCALDALEKLVTHISNGLGVSLERVRLIGSSAGGFAAIKMCERFSDISVLAINPQLYLNRYTKSFFDAMINYSYAGLDESDVLRNYKDRVHVSEPANKKCIILQNTHDTKHLNKHLRPFIKSCSDIVEHSAHDLNEQSTIGQDLINVIYYEDEKLKHSPPSREDTVEYINKIWSFLW